MDSVHEGEKGQQVETVVLIAIGTQPSLHPPLTVVRGKMCANTECTLKRRKLESVRKKRGGDFLQTTNKPTELIFY